jgi:hypothetical protein
MSQELSKAQGEALRAFAGDLLVPGYVNSAEVLYAYNGVSLPTARALVRLGIAEWHHEPYGATRPGLTSRRRYQTDWAISLTTYGKKLAREMKRSIKP